jgi:hypothetical protein
MKLALNWVRFGFVFLDTYALSLAFLQKNWVRFVISLPIAPSPPLAAPKFDEGGSLLRATFLVGFGLPRRSQA